MKHSVNFYEFTSALYNKKIRYLIIRGYKDLPHKPDTDIDLVYHFEDKKDFLDIAKMHLNHGGFEDHGFSEYSQMIYFPFFTKGDPDRFIPNGCFRVDTYSSLFFKSPLNNFKTFWNVPYEFAEYVFSHRYFSDKYGIYIPDPGSDIVLLILRDLLDRREWKEKHIEWIKHLKKGIQPSVILEPAKLVFPEPEGLVSLLIDDRFDEVRKMLEKDMK